MAELSGRSALDIPAELVLEDAADMERVSSSRRFIRRMLRNRGAMVGLTIVVFIVLLAVGAPLIASYDPDELVGSRLLSPSAEFLLGTDNLGRDILSRLVFGARPSVGSAALATLFILSIGITVGAWSGYVGGLLDDVIMRIVDILLAFPTLILAMAIVGVLGPGLENMLLAITMVVWAYYARLVRGIVLELRERPHVKAALVLGGSQTYIIFRHIFPNIISPVIVLASLQMGFLILTTAGLSFLGLGIQPPTSEWGAMLNSGRTYFLLAPQLMIYPGFMISITVLGFNLLGDGLRDVLDPRHLQ